MPSAPRYYLADSGRRTGPHSLAVLKQLAEVSSITPDTLHAAESEPNDWSPLRDSQVLRDELFPPRPHYALDLHRPVEHVNNPNNTPVPSVDEMLRANLARQQSVTPELLKEIPRPNRRRRDCIFLLIAAFVLCVAPWFFIPLTIGLILLSTAAFLFMSLCILWILYGVMDRY